MAAKRIALRLDSHLLDSLDIWAEAKDLDRSGALREAIRIAIDLPIDDDQAEPMDEAEAVRRLSAIARGDAGSDLDKLKVELAALKATIAYHRDQGKTKAPTTGSAGDPPPKTAAGGYFQGLKVVGDDD